MVISRPTLTVSGKRKIEGLKKFFRTDAPHIFYQAAKSFFPPRAAAAFKAVIPTHQDEAAVLSRGRVVGGQRHGAEIGTPHNFIMDRMFTADAIAQDEGELEVDGTMIRVHFGSSDEINEKTKISWRVSERRGGGVLESMPFNGGLLQAYEFGGTAWHVTPREQGKSMLEPEPGVFVPAMQKQVPPIGMYEIARQDRPQFVALVDRVLRNAVQVRITKGRG